MLEKSIDRGMAILKAKAILDPKDSVQKIIDIAISTNNKMIAIQKNIGKHAITASDVAEWLNMTPRNARRILTNLEEQGLAKIIGEEVPLTRGRPRKIYQIGI